MSMPKQLEKRVCVANLETREAPINACLPDSESVCPRSVRAHDATTCGNGIVRTSGDWVNWPKDGMQ